MNVGFVGASEVSGFFLARSILGLCPKPRGGYPCDPAPFPFISIFQNGPRRQGFASPRKTGAPLTAPGHSEQRT